MNDFYFFFVFFFLSFSAFPYLFWLGKKQHWCFFNFFANFLWIFYYGSGRNSLERFSFFLSYSAFPNLCSLFLGLPKHILPRKEAIIVFYIFLNFFTIFLEFSITSRVGTPRNDFLFFIIFSLSRPFPTYFGLKSCQNVGFKFFEFFCYFFFNFLLRVG